jgi:hypothetical protein
MINVPKEMNAVSTKVMLRFFPPVCPFAPSIFSQVTPRYFCLGGAKHPLTSSVGNGFGPNSADPRENCVVLSRVLKILPFLTSCLDKIQKMTLPPSMPDGMPVGSPALPAGEVDCPQCLMVCRWVVLHFLQERSTALNA